MCEHEYKFNRYCGAEVCTRCNHHRVNKNQSLHHCYCGWNQTEEDKIEFANEES